MTTAVDVLVAITFVIWVSFVVTYHWLAAWTATQQGRNIMGVSIAVAGFLALALVSRIWPDFDRRVLQVLVYGWLALLGAQRLRQLVQLQRAARGGTRLRKK